MASDSSERIKHLGELDAIFDSIQSELADISVQYQSQFSPLIHPICQSETFSTDYALTCNSHAISFPSFVRVEPMQVLPSLGSMPTISELKNRILYRLKGDPNDSYFTKLMEISLAILNENSDEDCHIDPVNTEGIGPLCFQYIS